MEKFSKYPSTFQFYTYGWPHREKRGRNTDNQNTQFTDQISSRQALLISRDASDIQSLSYCCVYWAACRETTTDSVHLYRKKCKLTLATEAACCGQNIEALRAISPVGNISLLIVLPVQTKQTKRTKTVVNNNTEQMLQVKYLDMIKME